MFGFFKKKKKAEQLPRTNMDFLEEPNHRVSIGPVGRTGIRDPKPEPKAKPRKDNSAEARYLYKHVNHKTGKTHTVSEIAKKIGMSERTVYNYIKDLPKTKKRVYNANRG